MLGVFSYVCWPFVYLLWRDVYSNVLAHFKIGLFFFYYWVARVLCIVSKFTFNCMLINWFPQQFLLTIQSSACWCPALLFNLKIVLSCLTIQLSLLVLPPISVLSPGSDFYICVIKRTAGHFGERKEPFPNWICISFYWCITNYHKYWGLK